MLEAWKNIVSRDPEAKEGLSLRLAMAGVFNRGPGGKQVYFQKNMKSCWAE